MRYTVTWTDPALDDLMKLWMAAPDRNAVTAASDEVDRGLADDPEMKGVLRFHTVRILPAPPLVVEYEVVDADRLVFVLAVWRV